MSFLKILPPLFLLCGSLAAAPPETLPLLTGDGTTDDVKAPADFEAMWRGFDPRAEPLETEILKEWTEEGVTLRVVRFRVGVFKGTTARLAAIYGFPTAATTRGKRLPGLAQIHGGGQYADHRACVTNAKRGYATVSIAWAGRISAPGYSVTPTEVKLFWKGDATAPGYRVTTDWGAVDGYHAPGRNAGNHFPVIKPAAWTLDAVESPRNSGWFLGAVAARRALTFLERQPEVDPQRLGVYGHSMGGKLTVMTSVDERVRAAAPSCGGISDRDNASSLFRGTLGDDVSLAEISCPIMFLSPANDFHGRIGDLPDAVDEIRSEEWRVTCSPHHNHQDTPEYEVATQLWFDQHLRGTFTLPETPRTTLHLQTSDGTPILNVRPDTSKPVLAVDVYYTQQGKADERPEDRLDTMHRFWHHAPAKNKEGVWTAALPLSSTDKPLWVFANVRYPLDKPITGAGYYYGVYTTDTFNLSSLLERIPASTLQAARTAATLKPTRIIETFEGDWQREWFTLRANPWAYSTNKPGSPIWAAPDAGRLRLEVRSQVPNKLVVRIDNHVAGVSLSGGEAWQTISLTPDDFQNHAGEPLPDWRGIRLLKLSPAERLRPGRGQPGESRVVGANWKGETPRFRNLHWAVDDPAEN